MRLRILLALLAIPSGLLADESDGKVVVSKSPDGQFGVQVEFSDGRPNGGFEIVKLPGKEVIFDGVDSFISGVSAAWSPDSSKVALNGRAGARYESVTVLQKSADGFDEINSPEEATSEVLTAAMDKERVETKVPRDAYQRRIWDTWKLRQWIDDSTAEVLAFSERLDYPRDENGESTDEEGYSVAVYLRFKLQLTEDGNWEILDQDKVSESEVFGD